MRNLLKETEEILANAGKNFDDLIFAAGNTFRFPISVFRELADVNYNSGFGSPEVATDLILVGKDFWLERREYDGSEWWEYKEFPKCDDLPIVYPKALIVNGIGWETLEEINKNVLENLDEV